MVVCVECWVEDINGAKRNMRKKAIAAVLTLCLVLTSAVSFAGETIANEGEETYLLKLEDIAQNDFVVPVDLQNMPLASPSISPTPSSEIADVQIDPVEQTTGTVTQEDPEKTLEETARPSADVEDAGEQPGDETDGLAPSEESSVVPDEEEPTIKPDLSDVVEEPVEEPVDTQPEVAEEVPVEVPSIEIPVSEIVPPTAKPVKISELASLYNIPEILQDMQQHVEPLEDLLALYNVQFTVMNGSYAMQGALVTFDGQSGTTDANGIVTFQSAAGTFNYSVHMDGLTGVSGSVVVTADTNVPVVMTGNGLAVFTVKDTNGQPVKGATVTVGSLNVTTDSNGNAQMWLKAQLDQYKYTADYKGRSGAKGAFFIGDGQQTSVGIRLDPYCFDINFNVKDMEGANVRNAVIEIDGQSVTTNKNGNAKVENMLPGSYQYTVSKDGYESYSGKLKLKYEDLKQTVVLVAEQPEPTPAPTPEPPAPSNSGSGGSSGGSGSGGSGSGSGSGGTKYSGGSAGRSSGSSGGSAASGKSSASPSPSASVSRSPSPTPSVSASPSPSPTPSVSPSASPVQDGGLLKLSFNLYTVNNKPIPDMTIELHSSVMQDVTNKDGNVLFEDVGLGDHKLFVRDTDGNILAKHEFIINSGVSTDLDVSNLGADIVYVEKGVDTVTIDAVYDKDSVVLTAVNNGLESEPEEGEGTSLFGNGDNTLLLMLIISVAAVAVAVVILMIAIKRMKETNRRAQQLNGNGNGNGKG